MRKASGFRIVIIWLAILLMASFWLTMREASEPLSLRIAPEVPREGEPVVVSFRLNNPSSQDCATTWELYANGELIKSGGVLLSPGSSQQYRYIFKNKLELGERLSFVVAARSELGNWQKMVSLPPYPPQVWTSFVSFASFSTSMMSSMSSLIYYQTSFATVEQGTNVGFISALTLIALLIFLELVRPLVMGRTLTPLGRLKIRYSTLAWILFIIFMGMVYTKMVMLLI